MEIGENVLDSQASPEGAESLAFRVLALLHELSGLVPRQLDKGGLWSQKIRPAKQVGPGGGAES